MVRDGFGLSSNTLGGLSSLSNAPLFEPQGRLCLTTLTPIHTSTVSAQGTVFYTPYKGNLVPVQNVDGGAWGYLAFSELSNILANSATGSAGPAAAVAFAAYDLFVWNNAGTPTLTRGPAWAYSATVTTPVASPGIVTWTGHGLSTGMVFQISGGTLPTGLVAGTNYFIHVIDANTFHVSSTMANLLAGTYINFTGSSSGTQTGLVQGFSRGTGAGTTELKRVAGLMVNANAITNGPAAGLGTYVGTVYTDSSGATVTINLGSSAAGGGQAWLGVWNAYNRKLARTNTRDSTTSYAYSSASMRPADGNANNSLYFITGLSEDAVCCGYSQRVQTLAAVNAICQITVGLDSITGGSGDTNQGYFLDPVATAAGSTPYSRYAGYPGIGIHYLMALEASDGTNGNFFNTSVVYGGLKGEVWC